MCQVKDDSQNIQIRSGSLQCDFRRCSGTKVILKEFGRHAKEVVCWERNRIFKLTSDRETTEAPLGLELLGFANGSLGGEDNGIKDEAVLVSLHLADHLGLSLRRAVVVDDTETTEQGHVDGHVVLGDGVHGRRQKGSLQRDTLGNRGIKRHIGGREACPN